MTDAPLRLAMWSGPRNLSTALLRSWGNRPDTFVCDEPLYAHYLAHTGLDHPGREAVIAAGETDWRKVVAWLTGPIPEGKPVFYQKHMTHHLLPEIDRGWLSSLTHAFLIRDPREMLASLGKTLATPRLADTGLAQQVEIFDLVHSRTGRVPPVVDARDVLENPRGLLHKLCDALDVAFDDAMLAWPPGPRPTDGVWGKHWYHSVWRSTGFEPWRPPTEPLPRALEPLLEECLPYHRRLHEHRLAAER